MQHQRYVLLTFAVGAILLWVAAQSGVSSLFERMAWSDEPILGLSESTLIATAIAIGGFVVCLRTERAITFVDEVMDELLKVTWPTREDTLHASTTVIGTTFFVASVISAYDFLWKKLADLFLYKG